MHRVGISTSTLNVPQCYTYGDCCTDGTVCALNWTDTRFLSQRQRCEVTSYIIVVNFDFMMWSLVTYFFSCFPGNIFDGIPCGYWLKGFYKYFGLLSFNLTLTYDNLLLLKFYFIFSPLELSWISVLPLNRTQQMQAFCVFQICLLTHKGEVHCNCNL